MAGMSKYESEVRRLLDECGAECVRKSDRSEIWNIPGGHQVAVPLRADPDSRTWINLKSKVRGYIKANKQREEEDVSEADKKIDLESAGVMVNTKIRRRVETTKDFLIDKYALARLIGVLDGPNDPGDELEIDILDADGTRIDSGGVYLRVKTVEEEEEE